MKKVLSFVEQEYIANADIHSADVLCARAEEQFVYIYICSSNMCMKGDEERMLYMYMDPVYSVYSVEILGPAN